MDDAVLSKENTRRGRFQMKNGSRMIEDMTKNVYFSPIPKVDQKSFCFNFQTFKTRIHYTYRFSPGLQMFS